MTYPKIAVYAISLNEEKFVDRFCQSCQGADYIIVADTGSTDSTKQKLIQNGVIVHDISVKPFRFDTARNISLGLVPSDVDICISMDLDEVLTPNWLEHIRVMWANAEPKPSSISYKYVWSWNSDNTPSVYFRTEKIHARYGYNWRYPCHEALTWTKEAPEIRTFCELEIHHYPDSTKSRGQYLDILKMGVRESPWAARPAYYYARELFFTTKYTEAIKEFERYLNLSDSTYVHERAAALVFIGQAAIHLQHDYAKCMGYFKRSNQEVENGNAYMWAAKYAYQNVQWSDCLNACLNAIKNSEDQAFSSCPEINSSLPYDYLSICSWYLKDYPQAVHWVKKALEYEPHNQRLLKNQILYQSKSEL